MDAFEEMEQELFNDGVTVFRDKLPKCIGYYTNLSDFIYLNVDRDLRGAQAFSVLSHEMGHHRAGLVGQSGKDEHRADKWAATSLIHPLHILYAVQRGCKNFYELSRDFNVDEQYMRHCLAILSEIHGEYYEAGEYILSFNPLIVQNRLTKQVWPEVWY